jgi:hypothetical protein
MMEGAVAAAGFSVCGYLTWAFASTAVEERKLACLVLAWPFGLVALFCLVRFVYWAWNTPMPFVSRA